MNVYEQARDALDNVIRSLDERDAEIESLRAEVKSLRSELETARMLSRDTMAPGLWIVEERGGGRSLTRLSEVVEWAPDQLSAWLAAGKVIAAMSSAIVAKRGEGASAADLALAAAEAAVREVRS